MRPSSSRTNALYSQAYREYVQFLNELVIEPPVSVLLLAAPSLILIADMLHAHHEKSLFLESVSYLGLSPALLSVAQRSDTFGYLMLTVFIFVTTLPLWFLASIVLYAHGQEKVQKGEFKSQYEQSWLQCGLRNFFVVVPFFMLPLTTSQTMHFLQLKQQLFIMAIATLVLTALNTYLVEYHTFELKDSQQKGATLNHNHFVGKLIDDLLMVVLIVVFNFTSGMLAHGLALNILAIRYLLTLWLPFMNGVYLPLHKTVLLSTMVMTAAIGIAELNQQYQLSFLVASGLIALLFNSNLTKPDWQVVDDDEGIASLRRKLWKEGLFGRCFKELIFMSRQNNSHRTQLEIEILKSQCALKERFDRGGWRMCGAEEVITYEEEIIHFVEDVIVGADIAVSVLKLLEQKEPKNLTMAKQVNKLMDLMIHNKTRIKKILELNENSSEAYFLLMKIYGDMCVDSDFVEQRQKWRMELSSMSASNSLKTQLFSDKTAVMFLNVLEDVGRITKVSKNVPAVLGYTPSDLLGVNINEIIPQQIRRYHDQMLIKFVDGYAGGTKRQAGIRFYAISKSTTLVEVEVHFHWVLTDFDSFHLSGVVQRIDSDVEVILTDESGCLQGWTKTIGEQLSLDQLSIINRKTFNVMSLFPTLIKYSDSLGVCTRTIFFHPFKPGTNRILGQKAQKDPKVLLRTFFTMMKEDELSGTSFGQIEYYSVSMCHNQAKLKVIKIHYFEKIENFHQVLQVIASDPETRSIRTEKLVSQGSELEGSQKQELSVFSQQEKADKKIDSNFTLNAEGSPFFPIQLLVFGQMITNQVSFDFTTSMKNGGGMSVQRELANDLEPKKEISLQIVQQNRPALQKAPTLFGWALMLSGIFLTLMVLNMFEVYQTASGTQAQNNYVLGLNRAAMIYMKSAFNPNSTYINKFSGGQLLLNLPRLLSSTLNYTSFLGVTTSINSYYLFNTQIPATLQRLLLTDSNLTTSTIPLVSALHYSEMQHNFDNVVSQYDSKFYVLLDDWQEEIDSTNLLFSIKLTIQSIIAVVMAILLVILQYQTVKHRQILEAFFKFDKTVLEKKIRSIGGIIHQLENNVAQWHLLKDLNAIVKTHEVKNIDFELIKHQKEVRHIQSSQQEEVKLEQKQHYTFIITLLVFLAVITVCLVLHCILGRSALNYYNNAPNQLNRAAKLIVFPNLLVAELYLPIQPLIRSSYQNTVDEVLQSPLSSIPSLYSMFASAPCSTCTFMTPVLTTNYRSFYSTLEQNVAYMRSNGGTLNSVTIQDMFLAIDVVTSQIDKALVSTDYNYIDGSIVVFIVAAALLCFALYRGSYQLNSEIERLSMFLGFFEEDSIVHNKHLNRLFENPA